MTVFQTNDTERMLQQVGEKREAIRVAAGCRAAGLVLKNASYVNVFTDRICRGDIAVAGGQIAGIGSYEGKEEIDLSGKIVLPGFIDAHIHLESSLVSPAEFVRAVLPHGTTTVVTDPHEIANVMGTDGIEYMLQATRGLPVDVKFMLPSCVPATPMDESGAELDYHCLDGFYRHPRVLGLAEVMDYIGTVEAAPRVVDKIAAAQVRGKVIDGHAPGLSGKGLNAYITAGVQSDHECSDLADAMAKIELGQYIMIREGTAAKNLDALLPLLKYPYASRCMFCCDDKHPGDLLEAGHIDHHIRRAIAAGVDPILAVKAASWNAANYFHMERTGAIAPGYRADMVVVDDLETLRVRSVFKDGRLVAEDGCAKPFEIPRIAPELAEKAHSTFHASPLTPSDFRADAPKAMLGLVPGEIVSRNLGFANGIDIAGDILKIAVVERHRNTGHIGIGYIKGYGLSSGAVAASISHDSHNIIVVGTNDDDMAAAVNRILSNQGGIVLADRGAIVSEVVLSIAGIMSEDSLEQVNSALEEAKRMAHERGVGTGIDPFMTLSFMALPVIPELRITTRGMVDALTQTLVTYKEA